MEKYVIAADRHGGYTVWDTAEGAKALTWCATKEEAEAYAKTLPGDYRFGL